MIDDDRNCARRKLITYPQVVDHDTGRVVGRVVDLSPRGLRLVSRRPLNAPSPGRLKMLIPANSAGASEISFGADPVWSEADRNPDYTATGFRITDIDPRDAIALSRLLRRWTLRD